MNDFKRSPSEPRERYSPGMGVVTADRQLIRAIACGEAVTEKCDNGDLKVTMPQKGVYYTVQGGWGSDRVPTAMLGAICGDVIGSVYEWHNIKHRPDTDKLVNRHARFTDDSVMTCAVAKGLIDGMTKAGGHLSADPDAWELITDSVKRAMQEYGRRYPRAGYGGRFSRWIYEEDPAPYNSWGNGSAMRASFAGWMARSLHEAECLAEITASVTHDHPDGIAGAKVVAGCIFLLRRGADKRKLREYIRGFYDVDFTLDSIRQSYAFDVSCAGSVPQALVAFLENDSYADVIAAAISIGGDSDTIAAIAGSLAEVIYPIPLGVRTRVLDRLDPFLIQTVAQAVDYLSERRLL